MYVFIFTDDGGGNGGNGGDDGEVDVQTHDVCDSAL